MKLAHAQVRAAWERSSGSPRLMPYGDKIRTKAVSTEGGRGITSDSRIHNEGISLDFHQLMICLWQIISEYRVLFEKKCRFHVLSDLECDFA
jgi:hypothetical protein